MDINEETMQERSGGTQERFGINVVEQEAVNVESCFQLA